MLQSVKAAELSKVEMECLQRVAIGQLQSAEISVSYGLLKGTVTCSSVAS